MKNSSSHYLVGDNITVADVVVCHYRWLLEDSEFALDAAPFINTGPRAHPRFERHYHHVRKTHFADYYEARAPLTFYSKPSQSGHPDVAKSASEDSEYSEPEAVKAYVDARALQSALWLGL